MSTEKPVHVPRSRYPEPIYPVSVSPREPAYPAEGRGLLDYWHILVSRRWTIIAIAFTVVLTTLIATLKSTPIYRATASIQIDRENQNILTFKDVYQVETAEYDTLQTQFEILSSRTLARRVIQDLRLDESEEFKSLRETDKSYLSVITDFFMPVSEGPESPADPLRPYVDAYLRRLDVVPVRLARLVSVSFEGKDPELAARIINAHAKTFIEQNLQFKFDATQEASEFLSKQLVSLKANLEKAEDRLQQYSREKQILYTEEGQNTATEKLQQLEAEYTRAQADRFEKESYDRLTRAGNTNALPQISTNTLIANLTSRLAELQREESDLSVTFAPEYPRRKRIRNQIDEIGGTIENEKDRIVQTISAEYMAALEREELLSGSVEAQKDVVNTLNQEIIQYNILKREVESNRQLYDGLLTRLKEAGVSAGLRASNIRVVDQAEIPAFPVRPRKLLNMLLSVLFGLALGAGLAFIQDYTDNSVRSPEDVTHHFNLPTLATIPKLQSLTGRKGYGYGRSGEAYGYTATNTASTVPQKPPSEKIRIELITYHAPTSLIAEAYRSMRTSLLLSSADHPPRSVVITSAVPSEGKTVTAVNTAISLTQTGARVVLVDCDMRKPRVHSVFALGEAPGLSSFLTGSMPLKQVIHDSGIPNLFVIPCGVTPPNPAELILSSRFKQLTSVLREYFDYVVIDSPPLSHVSDARILASMSDGTILVVKALSTSRHAVRRVINNPADTPRFIGVVLNDLDVNSHSSHSYYSARYYAST